MLSVNLQNRISLHCYATVSHLFATFLNDKYRGPNFKWENFPKIAKSQCKGQVYMANIGNNKNRNECFEYAEELRISIESIKITHKNLVDTIHFTFDNKEYIARVSI